MRKLFFFLFISSATFAQTPQEVIEKYISAIGGKANIDKIKDITTEVEADAGGQTVNIKYIKKAPNKLVLSQEVDGQPMSKVIFDGTSAIVEAQGQTFPLPEEQTKALLTQSSAIAEVGYLNSTIKLESLPSQVVKEEDCNVIQVTTEGVGSTKEYYSKATGLKVRTDTNTQGMDVVTYFYNYKEYAPGVKFPMDMKQEVMGQLLESTVTSIKINAGIEDSVFEIKK